MGRQPQKLIRIGKDGETTFYSFKYIYCSFHKIENSSPLVTVLTEEKAQFMEFLAELYIPRECFQAPNNEWLFNDDGASFLHGFLDKQTPVHKSIRRGEAKEEFKNVYAWIIDCAVSNLTSLSAEYEGKYDYLSPEMVRTNYWIHFVDEKGASPAWIPGLSWLSETQQELIDEGLEFDELTRLDILNNSHLPDLLYVASAIDKEADDLRREYLCKKCELFSSWILKLSQAMEFRITERQLLTDEIPTDLMDEMLSLYKQIPKWPSAEQKLMYSRKTHQKRIAMNTKFSKFFESNTSTIENIGHRLTVRQTTPEELWQQLNYTDFGSI